MMQPIVIAVSSSALFDTKEEELFFESNGVDAYKKYCIEHANVPFEKGSAYPLIKKLLHLNEVSDGERPVVEVVILSRNSAQTGERVIFSIAEYDLDVKQAIFTDGHNPRRFCRSFGVSLFLSSNLSDVQKSVAEGIPAGYVVGDTSGSEDGGLLVALDFDGIVIDDESEQVYKSSGLEEFTAHEKAKSNEMHNPGPLFDLLSKLAVLRALDIKATSNDKHRRALKLALVTARSIAAHKRVLTTLRGYGVEFDITAFMAGEKKHKVLNEMKPDVFFDDQIGHLTGAQDVAMVHIPYGVANK
ncbi:5'-nucleotidase [Vibrio owensii]|uniref:5'-nucleotidase n=1 Tax=Vibrio owensii TaxID=696485 RepID=UPI0018F13688|nr:5'-nucleotidase [Vibrio owensii]